jgi:ATP-dependent helicase HrpB
LDEAFLSAVFPAGVKTVESVELVQPRGAVAAVRRRMFGRLILDERTGGRPDPEQAAALLAAEVRRDPWRHLGDQADLLSFLSRLRWLAGLGSGDPLPVLGDADVAEAAAQLCAGKTRLAELAGAPVLSVLRGTLPGDLVRRVQQDAPERIELPSGRRASIDYASRAEPFVAARLQEFFGLRETPRLAGGRVPLLLHLLAPNHRPVQITRDLQSFWLNVYPAVRNELRRRYPKHAWPEDPSTANAESRPRRRR